MKTMMSGIFAALLLASAPALAADAVPAAGKTPVKSEATPGPAAAKAGGRSAAGPVKVAAVGSQQNRMRECNKSATGKRGAERKAFMKACLSTRKS